MNANELADEFQNRKDWKLINYIHWSEQSETMIRQQQAQIVLIEKNADYWADKHSELIKEYYKQQAEIGALRKSHIELERGIVKDLNQRQRNEPVAWMVDGVLFTSLGAALNISFDIEQPCIPLYTHPVKELTDSEIQEISHRYHYTYNPDYIGFARAILKKARE